MEKRKTSFNYPSFKRLKYHDKKLQAYHLELLYAAIDNYLNATSRTKKIQMLDKLIEAHDTVAFFDVRR